MASTNVQLTYATPSGKNAWAYPADAGGWRKVKGTSTDGVTNTFLLLALARATGKQATVNVDASNEITSVYL